LTTISMCAPVVIGVIQILSLAVNVANPSGKG